MIPFRLLAVVGDVPAAEYVMAYARENARTAFGLMLRDPAHDTVNTEKLARAVVAMPFPPNLCVITNGCSVEGVGRVHLQASQALQRPAAVRLTASKPFGVSVHSMEESAHAVELGAEYVLYGPVFPTRSKPGHSGHGVEALGELCRSTSVPVFALGGITELNAAICLDAGAHGIAAISLFAPAARPALDRIITLLRDSSN
ncbi:MAG TPA: thiamine phosphate synthase [Candidatus Kapabacteria bacterium]|nr:thiamine phosphate synthase [Candidatus Kapabacteria bacterium]